MKDFKYSKEEIVEKTIGKLQEGEKTFSDLPQNIVVTESQFERLMEQCLGGPPAGFANLEGIGIQPEEGVGGEEVVDDTIILNLEEEDELEEIVNEAYSLINEAIKTERITLLEQGMYDRNPGVAAGEGIENIINHVKKAWEFIKDPTTRQKLENSIVKLSNFMTKTAELMAAGRDQRGPRADSSILKDMPYPEHEEGFEITSEDDFTDEEEITETMIDDDSDEEMEEGYENIDHSDRSRFDDRTSRVVGVDSDIDDQRMEESVQKELKLMTETWQTVVGNTLGTALGTALAGKASEKMGLGEDEEDLADIPIEDDEEMVSGEFDVTEDDDKVLGTGISDDEGEGMMSGSPEDEAGLERADDSGEFYEEYENSGEFNEVELEAEAEVEGDDESGGDDGATDNTGQRT